MLSMLNSACGWPGPASQGLLQKIFIFQVLKFLPFRFLYSSFAKVELQFPNKYDTSQVWNITLDDVNPRWMNMINGLSGHYLRDYSKNEIIVDGK